MIILLIGLLTWSVCQNVVYYRRINDYSIRMISYEGYPPVEKTRE